MPPNMVRRIMLLLSIDLKLLTHSQGQGRIKLDRLARSVPDLQRVILHRDRSVAEKRMFIEI